MYLNIHICPQICSLGSQTCELYIIQPDTELRNIHDDYVYAGSMMFGYLYDKQYS